LKICISPSQFSIIINDLSRTRKSQLIAGHTLQIVGTVFESGDLLPELRVVLFEFGYFFGDGDVLSPHPVVFYRSHLTQDPCEDKIERQENTRRYERGPVILTSNQSFANWGEVFGDRVIATAILDRLLHHGITVTIRGDSYRLKEKIKAGLLKGAEAMA